MSDLDRFAAHAHRMATAQHLPTCRALWKRSGWLGESFLHRHPDPDCGGCVSDADRALWAQMAAEVDTYLAGDEGLFA